MGDGFVEVVHDDRVEVEEDLHDVLAQLQGQAEVVAVVVVGDVLAPVDEPAGDVGLGVLALGHGDVDLLVAAVDLEDGRDQDDGVLADGLDEGRLVDGDAVGELHEHLDRAGLAGVHAARGPVDRLGLLEERLGLGLGELAGIGQLGVDLLVVVEVPDRLLVGDGDDDPVAAFLGLADVEDLDPGRGRGQGPHVLVDVGRVAQDVLARRRCGRGPRAAWGRLRRRAGN